MVRWNVILYFLPKWKATVLNKLFCPPLCLSNPIMKLCHFDYLKYPVKCSARNLITYWITMEWNGGGDAYLNLTEMTFQAKSRRKHGFSWEWLLLILITISNVNKNCNWKQKYLWHILFFKNGGLVSLKARERINWEGREMFRFLGCAPQVPVCQFTNKLPARQWGETAGSPANQEHLSLPPSDAGSLFQEFWLLFRSYL